MDKPKIYLAGSINGLTYSDAVEWYSEVALYLPEFELLTPMREKNELKGCFIDRELVSKYAGHRFIGSSGIVRRDKIDVRRCDAVLANLRQTIVPAIGTACEITLAYELRKPVICAMADTSPNNPNTHPFITQACDWIVPTIKEACVIIRSIFNYPALDKDEVT